MQKLVTLDETASNPIGSEVRVDESDESLHDVELHPEDLSEWLDEPSNDKGDNGPEPIESNVKRVIFDASIEDIDILQLKSESKHELFQAPLEIDNYPTDSSLSVDFDLEEILDVGETFESLDFPTNLFDDNECAHRRRKRSITSEIGESTQQPRHKTAKKDVFDSPCSPCETNCSLPNFAHTAICDPSDRTSQFAVGVSTKPSLESDEYKHAMKKLRASMERSELSRSQVLRNRRFHSVCSGSVVDKSTSAPLTTLQSLSDLFSGKRNCLTSGLEASRRQLGRYLSLISSNQLF